MRPVSLACSIVGKVAVIDCYRKGDRTPRRILEALVQEFAACDGIVSFDSLSLFMHSFAVNGSLQDPASAGFCRSNLRRVASASRSIRSLSAGLNLTPPNPFRFYLHKRAELARLPLPEKSVAHWSPSRSQSIRHRHNAEASARSIRSPFGEHRW